MFKKKNRDMETSADITLRAINNQVVEAYDRLKETVKRNVVKKEVIDIYPDGEDKEKAIKEYNFEQKCLLKDIAYYDDMRNKFNTFLNNKFERKVTAHWKPWKTSHEVVECVYKITKGMW